MAGDVETVEVVNWPLRDEFPRSWALAAMTPLTGIAAGWVSGSLWLGAVGAIAVAASMWRLWLPAGFELGPRGITYAIPGRKYRIAWTEFQRYQVTDHGVRLYVDAESTRLDAVRGLEIRWRDRREDVLAIVDRYVRRAASATETTITAHPSE